MSPAKTFLATLRFELRGVRSTLWMALGCAAVGLAAPVAATFRVDPLFDAWRAAAIGVSLSLIALTQVPALARTWTGGLRNGTLSFTFSRPVSSSTLWWARLASSMVLAASALCIGLIPAVPWAMLTTSRGGSPQWAEVAVVTMTFAFVLLVATAVLNAVSLLAPRPRLTGTLALLVAALLSAVVALFSWWSVANLLSDWSEFQLWSGLSEMLQSIPPTSAEPLVWFGAVAGTSVGLLVSSFRQLSQGRTDPERARRQFLKAFGVAMLLSTSLPASLAWWALNPTPSALDSTLRLFEAPRASGWLVAAGNLKLRGDDVGIFLIEASTGRWFKVLAGTLDFHFDARDVFSVSEDGTLAIVSEINRRERAAPMIRKIDLVKHQVREIELQSVATSYVRPIAALRTGQLLADEKGVPAVFDLDRGSRICSSIAPIPRSRLSATIYFSEAATGELLIFQEAGGAHWGCGGSREDQAILTRIDPVSCHVQVSAFCAPGGLASRPLALDGGTGVGLSLTYLPGNRAPRELRRHDLDTGATTTLMQVGDDASSDFSKEVAARFLSDHSIFVTWTEDNLARAAVLSPDGNSRRRWTLVPGRLDPIAQLSSSRILLAHRETEVAFGRVLTFDPRTGDLQSLGRDVISRTQWLARSGGIPDSAVVEDVASGSPVIIEHDGSLKTLHLRSLP